MVVNFNWFLRNGNGDLVVNRSTNQMMPPPQGIEQLLSYAANFLLLRVRALWRPTDDANKWDASRSSEAKSVTASFLGIIGSLQTIREGFSSSLTVPIILEGVLEATFENETATSLEQILISYASIAGGAQPQNLLPLCKTILEMKYKAAGGGRGLQWERSLFQCSKWGSLSLLFLELATRQENTGEEAGAIFNDLFREASDSVEACPTEGLLFLFDCITIATKAEVAEGGSGVTMEVVIKTMFAVLEADNAVDTMYMLDEICSILFNSEMKKRNAETTTRFSNCSSVRATRHGMTKRQHKEDDRLLCCLRERNEVKTMKTAD